MRAFLTDVSQGNPSIDLFAQDVGVAKVPRVFLNQVHKGVPDRDLAAPARQWPPLREVRVRQVVEHGVRSTHLLFPHRPRLGHHAVIRNRAAEVGVLVLILVEEPWLLEPARQATLRPVVLHGGEVAHQAKQTERARRYGPPGQLLRGEPLGEPEERLASSCQVLPVRREFAVLAYPPLHRIAGH